jgi:uncharacterized iron-regulated membrane protein
MTEIVLAVIGLALLGALLWREREARQERERLAQRIQAPEIAVREFAERPKRGPVMPVPIDDDAAYARAKERREGLNGNAD